MSEIAKTLTTLEKRVEARLNEMADEAFLDDDDEYLMDSDGLDQAERQGILRALDAVKAEIRRLR